MKKNGIVRFSADEIRARLSRGEAYVDHNRIDAADENEIYQQAVADNAESGFAMDWFRDARPVSRMTMEDIGASEAFSISAGYSMAATSSAISEDLSVHFEFKSQGRPYSGHATLVAA